MQGTLSILVMNLENKGTVFSVNKIFQIGFNRCATTSLFEFFNKNKVPSYHFWGSKRRKLAKIMKRNFLNGAPILSSTDDKVFFSDMEDYIPQRLFAYSEYYQLMDKDYPDSRFILNVRDVNDWIESRARLHRGKVIDGEKKHSNVDKDEEVFDIWKNHYYSHIKNVKSYFKGRASDLLVFDIDSDPISKLIEFFKDDISLDPKHWRVTNRRNTKPWN